MSALDMFRRRRHGLHVASVQPPVFAPADFSADTEMRYPQPRARGSAPSSTASQPRRRP